jgi:addiction module HigA family antidote
MRLKNGLAPVHPGEFLREILEELRLSQAALARNIGVSTMRISHIVNGQRPVTAKMALLFGKAFGQTPQYWLNLQTDYELKIAEKALKPKLAHVHALAVNAEPIFSDLARNRGLSPNRRNFRKPA